MQEHQDLSKRSRGQNWFHLSPDTVERLFERWIGAALFLGGGVGVFGAVLLWDSAGNQSGSARIACDLGAVAMACAGIVCGVPLLVNWRGATRSFAKYGSVVAPEEYEREDRTGAVVRALGKLRVRTIGLFIVCPSVGLGIAALIDLSRQLH